MVLTDEQIDCLKNQFKIDEVLGSIDYSFIEILGQGGQGVVVLTNDSTGIEKAVKIMKLPTSGGRANRAKIERLKNDIEFCSQYNHENIIKYQLYGEYPNDGQRAQFLYAVMDYFPKNLRDVIDESESYSPEQRLNYLIQLSKAIKDVHDKGIIHRDIKPENILIKDNTLVLTDFGIAHFKDSNLTQANDLLNNRNYLAPEQKNKGNATTITSAVDVFAFGLIINECFTKSNPHGKSYPLISDYYPFLFELDDLVEKCLNSDSKNRISINSTLIEIKNIYQNLKSELEKIKDSFAVPEKLPEEFTDSFINELLDKASQDIYFVTNDRKLIENKGKYNLNYRREIGYSVTPYLRDLTVRTYILKLCQKKYNHEMDYEDGPSLKSLDLQNASDLQLYDRLVAVLEKYNACGKRLSGNIRKYFVNSLSYHAEEILEFIEDECYIDEKILENIEDAPILWLTIFILEQDIEQTELINNIDICWDRTISYLENLDNSPLFEKETAFQMAFEKNIENICQKLTNQWGGSYDLFEDKIRFIFDEPSQFEKLKEYGFQLAKPYYVFEGDVIDLFKKSRMIDKQIIWDLDKDWDIRILLAKILGLKKIK